MQNIPWPESPFLEQELSESNLSAIDKDFVRSYADNGYAIFDPHIPEWILKGAVTQMSPRFNAIKSSDKRIQDAWRYNAFVREIAIDDVIMDKLRILYRRNPIPFQTLSFCEGTQQATHSDMIFMNSIPKGFFCGVWVALEDVTNDNGPLHYYPGSHKLPFYSMLEVGVQGSKNRLNKKENAYKGQLYTDFLKHMIEASGLKKETLNIKKGQAIIWSANLLHGGDPIIDSNASRFSQVTHYFFDDCIYYVPRLSDLAKGKIYYHKATNILTGKPLVSTYFGKKTRAPFMMRMEKMAQEMFSRIKKR